MFYKTSRTLLGVILPTQYFYKNIKIAQKDQNKWSIKVRILLLTMASIRHLEKGTKNPVVDSYRVRFFLTPFS